MLRWSVAAIWKCSLEMSFAAFLHVPREIRLVWYEQRENTSQHALRDTFENEAVGSSWSTWPGLFWCCLWINFIDNLPWLIVSTLSPTLLTGFPEDEWNGKWCLDTCPQILQSVVVWSSTIASHPVEVHRHHLDSRGGCAVCCLRGRSCARHSIRPDVRGT